MLGEENCMGVSNACVRVSSYHKIYLAFVRSWYYICYREGIVRHAFCPSRDSCFCSLITISHCHKSLSPLALIVISRCHHQPESPPGRKHCRRNVMSVRSDGSNVAAPITSNTTVCLNCIVEIKPSQQQAEAASSRPKHKQQQPCCQIPPLAVSVQLQRRELLCPRACPHGR